MTSRKCRAIANPSIGLLQYVECLRAFRSASNFAAMDDVIGPRFVAEPRGVTPHDVVALSPLLDALLQAGATNCMVYPSRLEAAANQYLSEVPLRSKHLNPSSFANKFATHTQHVFGQLRRLVMENRPPTSMSSHQPYPKTNSFRKSCSSSEWVVVNNLMGKVRLDVHAHSMEVTSPLSSACQSPRAVQTPCPTHCPSPPHDATTPCKADPKVEVDECGFPVIFQGTSQSQFQSLSRSDSLVTVVSQCSTVLYSDTPAAKPQVDEDGYPIFDNPPKAKSDSSALVAFVTPPKAKSDSSAVLLIDGNSRRRKKETLESRTTSRSSSTKSSAKKYTRQSKAEPPMTKCSPKKAKVADSNVILSLRYSGPTQEARPRVEILAKTADANRLFICTLHVKSRPDWSDVVASMQAVVATKSATKADLLYVRDHGMKT